MAWLRFVLLLVVILLPNRVCFAQNGEQGDEAPVYYIVKTEDLVKLAPTDAELDRIPFERLEKMSLTRGTGPGANRVHFELGSFRFVLNLEPTYNTKLSRKVESVRYELKAGDQPEKWNVVNLEGVAERSGKHLIAKDWRNHEVVVLIRLMVAAM